MLELISSVFSLVALAASPSVPVPEAGQYAFGGDYQAVMKLQYRVVYGFTDTGAAELKKRLKAGEECSNTGREIWLCKSFGSAEGSTELLRSRVNAQVSGKNLVLGALRGEPGLVSQGQDVAEYSVPQQANFAGKSYDTYRLVNVQGNWSVRLGETTESQFNIENGELRMPLEVTVTLSREAYDVYVVAADFRRI